MATIANQYDPNNPNANPNNGGSGTVMPPVGGGEASSGGGGSSTSSSGAATPYQPPNVSQYLAANQGAGEQLTQGITSNVQSQANQLGTQQANAANTLNKQYSDLNANLNTTAANEVAQTAFQNPQQLLDAYNASKATSSNQPLSQPLSPEQQQAMNQYNQFQQLNTGGYNQDIQSYGNQGQQLQAQLQNQLAGLTQQTGATQNELGRSQLLQNTIGQGNYNQGQQTLDTLFLQGAPGQRNAGGLSNLQQLQQNLSNIGNQASQNVKGLGIDVQNRLAALQGLAGSDQALIKNLFLTGGETGTGLNQIAQNVSNEYAGAQQKAQEAQNIQNLLKENKLGQLTADQINQLGLEEGMQTWGAQLGGANAGSFQFNPLAAQGTAQAYAQSASPEEFARYNALNQLAGGGPGQNLQASIFGGATDVGYNPYSFNAQEARQAIDSRKNSLLDEFKNNVNSIRGINPYYVARGGSPQQQLDEELSLPRELMQGVQSGQLTPEQAVDRIKAFTAVIPNLLRSQGGGEEASRAEAIYRSIYSPVTNWYSNAYVPASSARLGMSTPEASKLPIDPATGGIDWSKINAPKGK